MNLEDDIEQAYWDMLAKRNGETKETKGAPMSERAAFKTTVRGLVNKYQSKQTSKDDDSDLDMPETKPKDWTNAVRGKFYRPIKD